MFPLVLCSLILIVTLAVSGWAKAKEPSSTVVALINLKLDHWIPLKLAARTVPWGELALAAALLLLPGWGQVAAAGAALLLFVFYWLVIARALASGNRASCNCFGSASQAPISGFTLLRNSALVAAAVGTLLLAFDSQASTLQALLGLDAQGWLWLLGAGLASVTLWAIYRSELVAAPQAEGAQAASGQAGGELADYQRAPIPFAPLYQPGEDASELGQRVTLRDLAKTQARLLVWVSPICHHCHKIVEEIPGWQQQLDVLTLHPVVSEPGAIKQLSLPAELEILVDPNYDTLHLFGSGTPAAVLLGADGLLAGGPVFGAKPVRQLVEDILAELEEAQAEEA